MWHGVALMRTILIALLLVLAACAPVPQRAGIPTEWLPSPNFNERKPNFVIIHHTSDATVDEALRSLTNPLREVSAHYLIGRDGRIIQLVDERARAWHAGESKWGADTDLNSASLGIELDNNGHEPFPDAQISALLRLLADIEARYHIPAANFLGHADIAPGRKVDPSRYFPWKTLARARLRLMVRSALSAAAAAHRHRFGTARAGIRHRGSRRGGARVQTAFPSGRPKRRTGRARARPALLPVPEVG